VHEHDALTELDDIQNLIDWTMIEANENADPKAITCITDIESLIPAWVIPTNEELEIAQQTQACLNLEV